MSARDARVQLNDLEEEEARIMRELRDLDEKAQAETEAKRRRQESLKEDPETALSQLLLECEKEVRDAKGYIADNGPPLKIVRVRHGESSPKGATYLSRPKNTGVDFTVPLTAKAYTDVVKKPIFLNQMRDKMKAKFYSSSEDYLEDMRLLARNTAAFNKGPELSWVVQHARFLLEAAEDAVTARRRYFYDVEDALRQQSITKQKHVSSLSAVGKRKRSTGGAAAADANGDSKGLPNPGAAIEVYWPNYRKWFAATIQSRQGSSVHVIYEEDSTDQWVNLDHGLKWRVKSVRGAASSKSKRAHEAPATKKRKAAAASAHSEVAPVVVTGGLSLDDLDSVKSDIRSMLDEMRESVTEQMSRYVQKMDRTLHRSDHLQRVLLAVDDSRNDMMAFMKKVDARCARMERILSQLADISIKPTNIHSHQAEAKGVQENDFPSNKEIKASPDPDATEKDEKPKEVVDEVIEIDDASTDKADELQVRKADQVELSKPAEVGVLVEEKEDDVSIVNKDVEMVASDSHPPIEQTAVAETEAKDFQSEKPPIEQNTLAETEAKDFQSEKPLTPNADRKTDHEGPEGKTAEASLEAPPTQPDEQGNAQKAGTDQVMDVKPELSERVEESVDRAESTVDQPESGTNM